MDFTAESTKSTALDQHTMKSDLQFFVASSEKVSHCTLSATSKSKNVTKSSTIMHIDGGSNAILVTSPSVLHSTMQTVNEVGNTGGGIAQTTHVGDLHMMIETVDRTVLLVMKQSCVVP